MITPEQLIVALNCHREGLKLHFPSILAACEDRMINTPERLAAFLANAAHETAGFSKYVENLNYSAKGLLATWPARFTPELAERIQRNPILIANHVYADRYGNNDQGDGWKYRGRGIFQTTFKDNYAAVSIALGYDFVHDPDKLAEPPFAAKSAAYYWHSKNLNKLADKGDLTAITKAINGGLNGHQDRIENYQKLIKLLS